MRTSSHVVRTFCASAGGALAGLPPPGGEEKRRPRFRRNADRPPSRHLQTGFLATGPSGWSNLCVCGCVGGGVAVCQASRQPPLSGRRFPLARGQDVCLASPLLVQHAGSEICLLGQPHIWMWAHMPARAPPGFRFFPPRRKKEVLALRTQMPSSPVRFPGVYKKVESVRAAPHQKSPRASDHKPAPTFLSAWIWF